MKRIAALGLATAIATVAVASTHGNHTNANSLHVGLHNQLATSFRHSSFNHMAHYAYDNHYSQHIHANALGNC